MVTFESKSFLNLTSATIWKTPSLDLKDKSWQLQCFKNVLFIAKVSNSLGLEVQGFLFQWGCDILCFLCLDLSSM